MILLSNSLNDSYLIFYNFMSLHGKPITARSRIPLGNLKVYVSLHKS